MSTSSNSSNNSSIICTPTPSCTNAVPCSKPSRASANAPRSNCWPNCRRPTSVGAPAKLPPTLILTTFDDSDVVLDGIRAGARGFMLKDVSYQQLIAAIRAVAGGATVFQPAVTERLLRAGTRARTDAEAPREPLTEREAEVVRLMAGGYSNKEIAHALGTAEGTIKNHVSSILAKFGVRDRTRAVLKALEAGLLHCPDVASQIPGPPAS